MKKLKKKLWKLEKEYEQNPLATLKNEKLLKRAIKLQSKIDELERK